MRGWKHACGLPQCAEIRVQIQGDDALDWPLRRDESPASPIIFIHLTNWSHFMADPVVYPGNRQAPKNPHGGGFDSRRSKASGSTRRSRASGYVRATSSILTTGGMRSRAKQVRR